MAGLIYSANFGGYDTPKPIVDPEDGIDYVMFTDGEPPPGWAKGEPPRGMKSNLMQARGVKVMRPYDMDHNWYLWLDATMQIKKPLTPLIEKLLKSQHDFAAFKHNEWDCAYREIEACLERRKDTPSNLNNAGTLLDKANFPINLGQAATGVLFRKNTEKVKAHALAWWLDMQATTMRDQCTFMLNVWNQGSYVEWIPGLHTRNPWVEYWRGHLQ